MKHVLALSSSRVGGGGYLEAALPLIRDFLPARSLTVAFLPFAAVDGDYEDYGSKVREGLHSLPLTIRVVHPGDAVQTVEGADVIMVGGGNTFKLLHDIYHHQLFEVVQRKVLSGTPYIGWSAGSNLAGLSIRTTNDMPIIQPPSFEAFGFFPFQINPHYINQPVEGFHGETRDQRLAEFVRLNRGVPVAALPEGTALLLHGDDFRYLGSVPGYWMESGANGEMAKREMGET